LSARGPLFAFFAFGAFWGAWGVLLPAVKEQTGASVSELGVALLFIAVAALPAMLSTGLLIDRFGPKLLPLTNLFFAAAVVLPGFAHSAWELGLVLAFVGAASGAFDVAINVAASGIETSGGGGVMQKAHALFSGGFLAASVLVGFARELGAEPLPILLAASGVLVVSTGLNRHAAALPAAPQAERGPRLRFTRSLVLLGLLCGVAFVAESGIENWSALFLETELDASPALAGLGPGFFAAAMVLGRSLGQRLEALVGDTLLLCGGGLVAAGGLTIAATAPAIPVAVAGFFLGGAGISVAAPTLFGAAGRSSAEHERGSSVATVTTISYLGFLGGPPLIGSVSGALDLRAGVALLAGIAVLVSVASASLSSALPLRRVQHPARR
jgi:MFS family permease